MRIRQDEGQSTCSRSVGIIWAGEEQQCAKSIREKTRAKPECIDRARLDHIRQDPDIEQICINESTRHQKHSSLRIECTKIASRIEDEWKRVWKDTAGLARYDT